MTIYVDSAGRAHWWPVRVMAGPLHSEVNTGDWSARVPFSPAARWLLTLRPHNPTRRRIAA